MMEEKKVSVIVPVYNVEKYVGKCIESIITQTYTNLEILINNDGSTDGSYEICKSYAEKDNRIRLFSQENKGLSAARNAMVEKVTGDYILFVDSDDWIFHEHVERLVSLLEDNGVDCAACNYIESSKDSHENIKKEKWKLIKYSGKQFAEKMTWLLGYRPFAWGRLMRKSSWDGISFPVGRTFEDMFTLPDVVIGLDSVLYTKEPLYFYRRRNTSISHLPFKLSRTDELDGYIHFTKLGMENGYAPLIRNGALFFVLVYIKFIFTMYFKGMNTTAYKEKYKQYFKLYLHMLLTRKYEYSDLVFRELEPLR